MNINEYVPGRTMVCGDWHSDLGFALRLLDSVQMDGVKTILHVGDFGYWPRQDSGNKFLRRLSKRLVELGISLFFIDGNHEDHWTLRDVKRDAAGVAEVRPSIFHLARGTVWTWEGINFLGFGGAHSVDRRHRTLGKDWFPEELYTQSDCYRAMDNLIRVGSISVMLTHDAPDQVVVPGTNSSDFNSDEIAFAERNRELLGLLVDEVKPQILLHGHFHQRYTAYRKNTLVIGLDMNLGTIANNVFELNYSLL